MGSAYELDAKAENKKYHSDPPILLDDEEVAFAAKATRDTILITNHRVFVIDPHGLTGKRVEYRSLYHRSIASFVVKGAGNYSIDTWLELYTSSPIENVHASVDWPTKQRFAKDVDISQVSDVVTKGILRTH